MGKRVVGSGIDSIDAARVTGGIECAAQDLSRRTLARGDTIGQVIRVPPEDRIFLVEVVIDTRVGGLIRLRSGAVIGQIVREARQIGQRVQRH